MKRSVMSTRLCVAGVALATGLVGAAPDNKGPAMALTPAGEKLQAEYAATLQAMQDRIVKAIAAVYPGL
jgi:hypothetical protein